jgi:hypothetical protein
LQAAKKLFMVARGLEMSDGCSGWSLTSASSTLSFSDESTFGSWPLAVPKRSKVKAQPKNSFRGDNMNSFPPFDRLPQLERARRKLANKIINGFQTSRDPQRPALYS